MNSEEIEITINAIVGIIFLGLLIYLLFWGIPNFAKNTEEIPEYRMYKHNIRSINYSNNISGSFFLGTGHIDVYDYYYMYIVNEDNSISLDKYDTDYARIYEDVESIEDSYIEIKEYTSIFSHSEYKIHIPKGYILYQIKLQGEINE